MASKVGQDVALATARMSVGFGSICLVLLAATDPESKAAYFHLTFSRYFLLILGVIFVFSAAQTIDSIIDKFEEADWKDLLGSNSDPKQFDQFLVRFKLFNGGYVLLSIGMAVLIWIFFSEALTHVSSISPGLSISISALFSVYVFLQMMTEKLINALYARIASVLAIGIIIGAYFFR